MLKCGKPEGHEGVYWGDKKVLTLIYCDGCTTCKFP